MHEDFEGELAKELVVPRRLLQVRYTPPLQSGDASASLWTGRY